MKIPKSLRDLWIRLSGINDPPYKIALGFALGVFLGIFPGAGPIASVVLSSLFRINTLAALTGSLITNTWISLVTFAFAARLGALATGTNWRKLLEECQALIEDFQWSNVKDFSLWQIVFPIFVGYILVGLILAVAAYALVMLAFKLRKSFQP